ncbi:hypothetical protein [Azospirillum rugosum]|uniref:Uncharacterized protein n=1 Tax=Azospirillum rugosum TaxID=416170 RepID=A0ABS4SV61_9PROT|nr:hypothetical protein [Azospirillum rugosum]MBP2295270.1 hypothetical protein [Azospirillum rugosum]MDQ0528645.1 hypothetical protein [Azospirillum rugosum]
MPPVHTPPAHAPLAHGQGCDGERHADHPADSNGLWREMMNRWLPEDPAG